MATFGPQHPRLWASANSDLPGDRDGCEGPVQSRASRPGVGTKAALTPGGPGVSLLLLPTPGPGQPHLPGRRC